MKKKQVTKTSIFDALLKDRIARQAATMQSHLLFFSIYFPHYIKYTMAAFQKEMFALTEDESIQRLFVVAFRGSAKSTIFTMSYPLWAILGEQQKKFVLILSQTQAQAKQHMKNIRQELETNDVLRSDLGPFQEESTEWGSSSLVFSRSNARITVASSEQSIRGLRHNQHRPDLIIGDDVEDITSAKTKEGRKKTYEWLTSEVIPTGDRTTRIVIVGNLLHEDSLLMRLKADIDNKRSDGVFKAYPLVQGEHILWSGKYPTLEDVEKEKKGSGNEYAWLREYMLQIVSRDDQAIRREWIQYYDELPRNLRDRYGHSRDEGVCIGVDLAISEADTADYTAMIQGSVFRDGDSNRIYILPNVVNKRIPFPEQIDLCKHLYNTVDREGGGRPTFYIEDVAYQKALLQELNRVGVYDVKAFRPNGDKYSRLVMASNMIKSGHVLFPREGCEDVINQIVHFGSEKYDDLADALTTLILGVLDNPPKQPRVTFL